MNILNSVIQYLSPNTDIGNNQAINSNNHDADVVDDYITAEDKRKVSFKYFDSICKSSNTCYITEELKNIENNYNSIAYKKWLLTDITIVTKPYPESIYADPTDLLTIDYYLSPIEYAVDIKNFNIAKELIIIANLKKQQNSTDLVLFLKQKYLDACKNNDSTKLKHLKKIFIALTETYANTDLNELDLMPLFEVDPTTDNKDFISKILCKFIESKATNEYWYDIITFFKHMQSYKLHDEYIKDATFIIADKAILHKKPNFIVMMLEANKELFKPMCNGTRRFSFMCSLNNYWLTKQCLDYINLEEFFVNDPKKGGFLIYWCNPSMHILNFCIEKHYNDSALAVIMHGVNISYTEHSLSGDFYKDLEQSQLALLYAIKYNNYNMLKILIKLNAKQCDNDNILNNGFICKKRKINVEKVTHILNTPTSLQSTSLVLVAKKLLEEINDELTDGCLTSVKKHIKNKNLLPPICVNKINSIEDLFLLC